MLFRSGRRYKKRSVIYDKRGTIPNRTDISQRPPEVEQRERFGDLEIDLIIGKNHKNAILTINDRATGLAKLRKLTGKDAEQLAVATIDCLKDWKPYLHTITSDNGKEFSSHQMIAAVDYSKYTGVLVVLFACAAYPKVFLRKGIYITATLSLLLMLPHLYWQYQQEWVS